MSIVGSIELGSAHVASKLERTESGMYVIASIAETSEVVADDPTAVGGPAA